MSSLWSPFCMPFCSLFYKSGPRDPGPHPKCPQDTNIDFKGTQMEAKGAEMKSQSLPKVSKRPLTIYHVCQNGNPRC